MSPSYTQVNAMMELIHNFEPLISLCISYTYMTLAAFDFIEIDV